jgi:hypothetical protein
VHEMSRKDLNKIGRASKEQDAHGGGVTRMIIFSIQRFTKVNFWKYPLLYSLKTLIFNLTMPGAANLVLITVDETLEEYMLYK